MCLDLRAPVQRAVTMPRIAPWPVSANEEILGEAQRA
jgi:hypothetical protein